MNFFTILPDLVTSHPILHNSVTSHPNSHNSVNGDYNTTLCDSYPKMRAFLDRYWGRVPSCAHCSSAQVTHVCSGTHELFCGQPCQWSYIAQGGKKRARDEQITTDDDYLSKKPKEVLQLLLQWLKLDDLRNVSLVNRTMYRNARLAQLRSFNIIWRVPRSDEDRQVLKDLHPHALEVETAEELQWVMQHLAPHVLKLHFDAAFDSPVDDLPPNVEELSFIGAFNQPLDRLPSKLTKLTIISNFNRPLDHLPQSLKHLSVGDEFNQTLDNLPRGLETLDIFGEFNHPLRNLPPSLQMMQIPHDYPWPLPDGLYVERNQ